MQPCPDEFLAIRQDRRVGTVAAANWGKRILLHTSADLNGRLAEDQASFLTEYDWVTVRMRRSVSRMLSPPV